MQHFEEHDRMAGEAVASERRRTFDGRPAALAGRLAVTLACILGLGAAGAGGCHGSSPSDSGADDEDVAAVQQGVASATCVNIRRGELGVVSDTYVHNGQPNTSFGGATSLQTGPASQVLMSFNFNGLVPAGAVISKAALRLKVYQGNAANINVHAINVPWTESVTYNQFYAGPGAKFGPAIPPPIPVTPNGPKTWDATTLAQGWYENPASNNGILLESNTFSATYSSEGMTHPTLTVCYFKDVDGDGYTENVDCDDHDASVHPGANEVCDGIDNNCDGLADEGLLGTPQNCGSCGNVCAFANANPACVNGACQLSSCTLGFGDCNGDAADGCETPLTTSTDCGGCGVACALPNASASCSTGTCVLQACNAGSYDCDGNAANGCEPTPCIDGSHCGSNADCQSQACVNGFCASPACSDGLKNGSETGVDCGGSCPPCGNGGGCAGNGDCQSMVCQNMVCQAPTCTDGTTNGNETGLDCGGGCPPCAAGGGCQSAADCASQVCVAGVCQPPSCSDGVQNGAETSPDCGGSTCPHCADGLGCNQGSDCASSVCLDGVCQMASCNDGVQNGAETDVDCGGTCAPCGAAEGCVVDADCASGVCNNGFCQAPSCTDGVQNGNETGVDCGGSCFVPETCNGVDDDCNGTVDEGLGTITCGVGACQVTVPFCAGGAIQTCTPGTPAAESCDGLLDDDCDGVVDNGCACVNGATQSCYDGNATTLGVGACHAGTQTCVLGQWGACQGEQLPTAETCNGVDDDCNGATDDGLGSTICGIGGCQTMVQNCVGGQPQACVPSQPTAETCDGIDNDCNGVADDGLPTITCGVGACQVTTTGCVNGQPEACTPGSPTPEACDGVDNDCDGQTDEGDPGGGVSCNSGQVGACSAGVTACAGGQITCNATVQPSAEVCDGVDNDCDGQTDEGDPGGGQACDTGLQGACAQGSTLCSGGQVVCSQTVQPSAEICDGVDNDCDGQSDEGNPGGGQACNTGQQGACAQGSMLCAGGQVVCSQTVQPSAEICDGVDNDCDGTVDESCGCADGETQPCYGGPAGTQGVGACHGGIQTCSGGVFGACAGAVTPSAETCDGADNDCNGAIDDGLGTTSCGVGACAVTVPACAGGQPSTCTPGAPSAEVCDGVDNDCNGAIDDNVPSAACSTGLLGVCAAGTTACVSAALVCVQTTPAAASENCANALDDTCDGQENEGCVCVPNSTASCYSGPAGTSGVGLCHAGTKTCNAAGTAYGACVGEVVPTTESCGTAGDDDCDGQTNEGCVCVPFTTASCYSGPAGTQGVGLCKAGTKTCNAAGTAYGSCVGEVVPAASESCHTQGDDNCNGQTNEGCAAMTCNLFTETFDPSTHPQNTAFYKADWCNETTVPSSNMPLCMAGSRGMRTNGTSSSAQLWVYRGTSSCTGVKISYQWYQFAQSSSSLVYQQSSDSNFANCPGGSFTTAVPAASQSATQVCSSTNNITIPFSADPNKNSVYIKFLNSNASNNAMWYDNIVVQLVGCPCN